MRHLAWFLLIFLLTGCASPPTEEPAEPVKAVDSKPTAEPVTVAKPQPVSTPPKPVDRFHVWGNFAEPVALIDGLRRATDLEPLMIYGEITAASAEEAHSRIVVEGAETWYAPGRQLGERWYVTLHVAAGPPGQEVRVTFKQEQPVTVTFVRQEGPALTLSRQLADGSWAQVSSGSTLPSGPLRLRIKTSGGVKASHLNDIFRSSAWYEPIKPDRFEVVADDLAEVEWESPPPVVQVFGGRLKGNHGLAIPSDWSAHLYVGEAPRLVAVDPVSGKEEALGEAPPDPFHAVVRADGRYVAFSSLDPLRLDATRVWLFDLHKRTLTPAPFRTLPGRAAAFDAKGRLVIPLRGPFIGLLDPATASQEVRRSEANFFGPVSPDGRYLVGHAGGERGKGTGGWTPPARPEKLVIHDLLEGTELVVPWEGFARPHMPLYWLSDGRLLQVVSLSDTPENLQASAYTVDLKTGERTPYPGEYSFPPANFNRWNARLTDTGGKEHNFGEAMPVGWLPAGRALLVRWPNFRERRHWMGP